MTGSNIARTKGADVHVALLRGVNVGGANKLPMSDLKAIFEDAGCVHAATIIQSGNVVFEAPAAIVNRSEERRVGKECVQ